MLKLGTLFDLLIEWHFQLMSDGSLKHSAMMFVRTVQTKYFDHFRIKYWRMVCVLRGES